MLPPDMYWGDGDTRGNRNRYTVDFNADPSEYMSFYCMECVYYGTITETHSGLTGALLYWYESTQRCFAMQINDSVRGIDGRFLRDFFGAFKKRTPPGQLPKPLEPGERAFSPRPSRQALPTYGDVAAFMHLKTRKLKNAAPGVDLGPEWAPLYFGHIPEHVREQVNASLGTPWTKKAEDQGLSLEKSVDTTGSTADNAPMR